MLLRRLPPLLQGRPLGVQVEQGAGRRLGQKVRGVGQVQEEGAAVLQEDLRSKKTGRGQGNGGWMRRVNSLWGVAVTGSLVLSWCKQ